MNKRSRSLFFISTLPLMISPIVIIASCASTNTPPADNQPDNSQQPAKIAFVSTQIRLDLANENANNYAQENDLKTLIFNNKEKIFTNIPSDFSINNIFVSQIMTNSPKPGELQAQVEIKNGNTVLLEKTLITFTGFQTGVLALKATTISLENQMQVDPKTYKTAAALKTFVFNQKEQIFTNLPNNFNEEQINVEQDSIKIRSGALIFTLSVKAGNNPSDNNLIVPTEVKLTGFMAVFAFKDAKVNLSGLSQEVANSVNEERLKQIIVEKKAEIFETIPTEGITEEQVLIEKKQKSIISNGEKLVAKVAVKNKNDTSLLINYETIEFSGFKVIIGLNDEVDLLLKLENGEENLNQYLEKDYSKLKTLIYKNRDSFFTNLPEWFTQDSFTITEAKIDNQQKGKLITKIKVPDPNGGSDLVGEKAITINGFFDLKNESIKLNFNLGEEYFLKYVSPPATENTEEQKAMMKKLVFDHQSEIFVNIPNELKKHKILIQNIIDESPEDLRVYFSISSIENENIFLLQANVLLNGFFDILKSPIKLTLETSEKPKNQYKELNSGGDDRMKNLIYKYKDKIFANLPKGFDQTWIQITSSATDVPGKSTQLKVGFKIVKNNQEILPEVNAIFEGFTDQFFN